MRHAGTIYENIDRLPAKAIPISTFAAQMGWTRQHVYTKYKRAKNGTTTVNYEIRCFKGTNYVIPH